MRPVGAIARCRKLFNSFRSGASLLAAPEYRLPGITIESIAPAKFIARFLGKAVEFTFSYDHAASHGVVAITSLSPEGDAIGPNWSFHFNGQGEVGDIEPRSNEGVYNIQTETDAAEIVLGAHHMRLRERWRWFERLTGVAFGSSATAVPRCHADDGARGERADDVPALHAGGSGRAVPHRAHGVRA